MRMRIPRGAGIYDAPVGRVEFTWLVLAVIGWSGICLVAAGLAQGPAGVGFDLRLLVDAGRDVALGRSPYDPSMLQGVGPQSTDLFYSYPPVVAQSMATLSWAPFEAIFIVWGVGAVGGLTLVGEGLRRRLAPQQRARTVAIAAVAISAYVLPFTVGLLFGNLDVWFPALYGVMLIAQLDPAPRRAVIGGVGLAVASLKLHPGVLLFWFLARHTRDRGPLSRSTNARILAAAVVFGGVLLAGSLLLHGVQPWLDYVVVVQAGAGADLLDARNAGPAAVIAGVFGGTSGAVRGLQVLVTATVIAVSVVAALRVRDPVESLGWAAAASLASLPVTWFHYPSAMIPFAIAAALRAPSGVRRRAMALLAAAVVTSFAALAVVPLIWVATGLVLVAVRTSAPGTGPSPG